MLKCLFLSFLIICTITVKAQINLVPNPSFEDTLNCPSAPDELVNSIGWSSYNGSCDYFHTSCPMSVPNNWAGYQQAASGNAYAAIATYNSFIPNYRECAGIQLVSPLSIGQKYFVSFQVSLSLGFSTDANCATNKTGAMFSTGSYTPAPIMNNPQVYTDSIISDSLNWTRIFGSFVSDSAYSYIIIGNFFDDLNTDTAKFYNTFSDGAYYYIDDVCLSTDSAFTMNYNYTSITKYDFNQFFSIYPNPSTDYVTIQSQTQVYNLTVYNTLGQELYSKEHITQSDFTIDLKAFKQGLLLINVTSDKYNFNYKLLKQ
jgi:hypothetical protein